VLTVGLVLVAQKEREAVRLREAGEQELYVAQINSAQEALEDGNFARYARLLDRHVPRGEGTERRGWEWYYLDSLRHVGLLTIDAHEDGVASLSFTADDKRLASGGRDGRARVWTVNSEKKVLEVEHGERVSAVAWSADDGQLVTAAWGDAAVRFWDGASGRAKQAFPVVVDGVDGASPAEGEHGVSALARAPHGGRWAAAWAREDVDHERRPTDRSRQDSVAGMEPGR
jgi:hypothetical protein